MLLFENFNKIHSICDEYGIENYTINPDGSVDVKGNVNLFLSKLDYIPLKFGKVSGYFDCSSNYLTTLNGSPEEVGGYFDCSFNILSSLENCPKKIGGVFNCCSNKLFTLKGGPKEVGIDFICSNNFLTSLEGSPNKVNNYYCFDNKLTSLDGSPLIINGEFQCHQNNLITLKGGPKVVNGDFICNINNIINLDGLPDIKGNVSIIGNPIYSIIRIFNGFDKFKCLLDDYNYLRGNKIIKHRFVEACIDAGIKIPTEIDGYDFI